MEHLQLVQRGNAKGSGCAFQQRLNFIRQLEIPAIKAALAISKRVGRGAHLSQISIGTQMQLADEFQIIVQHLVKRAVFLHCARVNHRQMQRHRANIKPSDKDRFIIVVCWLHATPLIPRRQKRTAPHRADNLPVFLIDRGDIALSCQAEPVRVHCLGRTQDSRLENILKRRARPIKKDDFREKGRLFLPFFALPPPSDV